MISVWAKSVLNQLVLVLISIKNISISNYQYCTELISFDINFSNNDNKFESDDNEELDQLDLNDEMQVDFISSTDHIIINKTSG